MWIHDARWQEYALRTLALSESEGLKTWERMGGKKMTIAGLQKFQVCLNYHVSKYTNCSGDFGLLRAFQLVHHIWRKIKTQDYTTRILMSK